MSQCIGTSKRTQERCTANAVTGLEHCAGHAGLGVAASGAQALREAGAKKGHEVVKARAEERRKTLLDRLAEGIERRAAEIERGYYAAGKQGDWRAYEALITRVHGKPAERVTVDTHTDPLQIATMSAEERAALMARVLEDHPELSALVPRTPDVHAVKKSA